MEEDLSPSCSVCGQRTATVRLLRENAGVRFVYAGPGGGNGRGDLIDERKAQALRRAFSPPFTPERIALAELYDDGGFCRQCAKFYCSRHWRSFDGAGRCPEGHFKRLDPHWSPDPRDL